MLRTFRKIYSKSSNMSSLRIIQVNHIFLCIIIIIRTNPLVYFIINSLRKISVSYANSLSDWNRNCFEKKLRLKKIIHFSKNRILHFHFYRIFILKTEHLEKKSHKYFFAKNWSKNIKIIFILKKFTILYFAKTLNYGKRIIEILITEAMSFFRSLHCVS